MFPQISIAPPRSAPRRPSKQDYLPGPSMDYTISPSSSYGDSPSFPHQLSDNEDDAQSHSESEYEQIASLGESSWGKWPVIPSVLAGSAPPIWATSGPRRASGGRKGSIISISPRGSIDYGNGRRHSQPRRPSRLGSDEQRRGSDSSVLLGANLANRRPSLRPEPLLNQVRRRSSVMSYMSAQSQLSTTSVASNSSSQYTDPEEAEHIRKIRSLESLGRRFSEVVEVTRQPDESSSESEHERDWTPAGSGLGSATQSMWSPDTDDTETEDDDDSEVASLPALPTPVLPATHRRVLSNFPLASSAVEESPVISVPRSFEILANSSPQPYTNPHRYQYTPSPPLDPAEQLRRLGRGPPYIQRPIPNSRPSFQRSVSSPLFASRSAAPQPVRTRQGMKTVSAAPPRFNADRRPSLARSLPEDEVASLNPGETKANSDDEMMKDVGRMSRQNSIANEVSEFSFLASQITLEEPAPASPVTPVVLRRGAIPSINLPTFTFPSATNSVTPLSTPFTPRFNPMDTFLGKSTPTTVTRSLIPSPASTFLPLPITPPTDASNSVKSASPVSPSSTAFYQSPPDAKDTAPSPTRPHSRPVSLEAMSKVMEIMDKEAEPKKPRPRSGVIRGSGSGGLEISHADLPVSLGGAQASASIQPPWTPLYNTGPRIPSGPIEEKSQSQSQSTGSLKRKPVPSLEVLSPEGSVNSHGHSPVESSGRSSKKDCQRCAEKRAAREREMLASPASRNTERSDGSHVHYRRHHHRNGEITYSISTSRLSAGPSPGVGGYGSDGGHHELAVQAPRARPPIRHYNSAATLKMPKPILSDSSSPEFASAARSGMRVTHARTPSPKRNKRMSKQISVISNPVLVSTTSKVVGTHAVGPDAVHPGHGRSASGQMQQRPGMQRSVSNASAKSTSTFHRLFRASPTSTDSGLWTNKASRPGERPISTDSSGSDRTLVEYRGIFKRLSAGGSPKKVVEEDEEQHGMFGPRYPIAPVHDVVV